MTDLSPRTYIVLVFRDAHRYYPYKVACPDFPSWALDLKDLGRLQERVAESLLEHIRETGEAPEPTPPELIFADEDGAQRPGVESALLLPVLVGTKARAQRINITMDAYLLAEVDATAKEMDLSRSAFLSLGAERLVRGHRPIETVQEKGLD